jgi:hypothetical protein
MKIAALFLVLAVHLPAVVSAQGADELLKTARFVATLQQQDLTGSIRKDRIKFPVALYLRNENMQFAYDQPATKKEMRFHMRLNDDHYDLFEIDARGNTVRFPEGKLSQLIEGTDLSYEDLAMRFLYWPNGIVEGEESTKGQDCHKLRIANPTGKGDYAQVRVWVHKKSRALIKVVGYNAKGQPLKRFQVEDIMKVGDTYTLRSMRVDRYEAATSRSLGVTYLEFDRPKAVAPGGLR